ncbi:hypothetical protein L6164_026394 [Bauhinia variegata]|uniref:Uncharacterized protein n=1 Tax=Bauhinia variegata TaxID=167791 RepID=A0ACB9LQ08_BAUVA|nr:hypothetical protein L6164_026394 [Bauhinia variegata]
MVQEIEILNTEGKFDHVSYRKASNLIQNLSSATGDEDFGSRVETLEAIMEALRDPNVNKIGVYGMAGVGKSTLVKQVAQKAQEEFDVVVMANITQNPEVEKIQGKIADMLGLNLSNEQSLMVPFNVLKALTNLEELEVKNCSNAEIVFLMDGEDIDDKNVVLTTELKKLILGLYQLRVIAHDILDLLGQFSIEHFRRLNLLQLHCFYKEEDSFPYWLVQRLPNLKNLLVGRSKFKVIFSNEGGQTNDHLQLKVLVLVQLPKLKYICKEAPSSVSFNELTNLEVSNCDGLLHLLTTSTAKSLVQLETMKIKECWMIKDIVANKPDDEAGD